VPAAGDASQPASTPLFVDGHVHVHPVFDLATFLTSAARNVADAARGLGYDEEKAVGVLLLAEGREEGAFARLRSAAGLEASPWTIHATREPESLLARQNGRLRFIVIAGRQIVTRERVEVLSLVSGEPVADGMSLHETLDAVHRANGVPVLPWGFGKWTMARGTLVASIVHSRRHQLLLGDNGGRLGVAPLPSLLAEARRLAVAVLPGSDPLPFRDQQSRAAAYGFLADLQIDEGRPAHGLRAWLRSLRAPPPAYGRLETLGRFCLNQMRMQWRKRIARR
jgi:hypothetical protein